LYSNPTPQMGYGIPDFLKAEQNLKIFDSIRQIQKDNFSIGYNSVFNTLNIRFTNGRILSDTIVRVYSMTGSLVIQQPLTESSTYLLTDKLQAGIYAVSVSENGQVDTRKVLIR
jgi:serine protease AprX